MSEQNMGERNMSKSKIPVTEMFEELIRLGHIHPVEQMEDMQMPGDLKPVPSITSYGTPDFPVRSGAYIDAELAQHSQRNLDRSGHTK